jgi:predicted cupin superfamily sugar epimerase
MTADEVIAALKLTPHPEGGAYVETFRDAASTAIYFLLRGGEQSQWHRIPSVEIWHHHAGAPLELRMPGDCRVLGPELSSGQRPQAVVHGGIWQSARSLGEWSLVGCTVAPPFDFKTFELAPKGWEP